MYGNLMNTLYSYTKCTLSWKVHEYMLGCFSHVWLFVTPWTVARQAPLSMEFSGQEYWSGLSCLPPGDLPDLGIKPCLLYWQAGSLPLVPPGKPKSYNSSSLLSQPFIFVSLSIFWWLYETYMSILWSKPQPQLGWTSSGLSQKARQQEP